MNRNARMGLIFFGIYALVYSAFVGLNAFFPTTMDWAVIPGLNLAIVYGLGLIGLAFVMALLYGWLCSADPPHTSPNSLDRGHDTDAQLDRDSIEVPR